MSQGTVLRISLSHRIVQRIPTWPWPKPDEYPKTLPTGETLIFLPKPYWNFPLYGEIYELPDNQD